jgi:hypothetical protein
MLKRQRLEAEVLALWREAIGDLESHDFIQCECGEIMMRCEHKMHLRSIKHDTLMYIKNNLQELESLLPR